MEPLGIAEPVWRLGAFAAIFSSLAVLEIFHPRLERPEMMKALKTRRWITNLSILVLSSLLLRLVFPLAAVGTALFAAEQGYGLLPLSGLPPTVSGLLAFVALDFAIWFEHVMSHRIPLLWRIHRMHHADTGFDVTTALRFHPLEILLSMLWKAVIILLLGPPALSVLIFEIVLNGSSMFNHSNLRLPQRLDSALRPLIVTPDMHRVHHSARPDETDTNYGFNLSIWDRLFSTYLPAPSLGHTAMEIGLSDYRDSKPSRLWWALTLPFRK
ncbi:sterol desaturase family protein [Pararhizobium sp.]|uniref:sterol desaturase family protein n=1 Tax=Pararhizobium sp. TaxID=1977563 RepID=UPI002717B05C|nr:sterol desaturase family protein [Pararhizobium sp.]MDO9416320.1 sterol desaturase family protein [Pararhizobium sp.]